MKHTPLPSVETDNKLISSVPDGGSKKWGESIAHWSIKREEPIVGNEVSIKGEEAPSFFFPTNSDFRSSAVFAGDFSKKRITIPLPVMEEEVIGDIITISKIKDRPEPRPSSWLSLCLITVIFLIIGIMTYKNHHVKFKENSNPFLEIKKKKTLTKGKKPLKKK